MASSASVFLSVLFVLSALAEGQDTFVEQDSFAAQDRFVAQPRRELAAQPQIAPQPRQQGGEFFCEHDVGFYPHDLHCDKYWACDAGVATLKSCGNGLAFQDNDPEYLKEECDYIYNVQCGHRTELEPPISTPHCDYLHGVFPDPLSCEVFYSCWAGEATKYECGPGLAYDRRSRICEWSDKVTECAQQRADEMAATGFHCPEVSVATGTFSRHSHPEDCRQYFVCFDGVPREYGCPIGTVFQIGNIEGHGQCALPEDTPGCENYYGDADVGLLKTLGL